MLDNEEAAVETMGKERWLKLSEKYPHIYACEESGIHTPAHTHG